MDIPINKRTPYLGVLLAFALILSYIESIIPINIGIPGIKLGLSNLAVILTIYMFRPSDGILICLLKSSLSCLLFGNMTMAMYSIFGALISCIIMLLVKKYIPLHIITVSAIGGVFHNLAQLCVGYFIIRSRGIFYYVPVLIISGLLFGMLIGYLGHLLLPYITKFIYKGVYS